MKKLLFAFAAASLLAGCNSKPGPEHTTPAEFGEVILLPVRLSSETDVVVKVPVTSQYGFRNVGIVYMLDGDESNVRTASIVPAEKDVTSFTYEGTIPRQKAGTKVSFRVRAITAYKVTSYSEEVTYTIPLEPDDDEQPE